MEQKSQGATIEKIIDYNGEYEKYKSDALGLIFAYSNFLIYNKKHERMLCHLPVDRAATYLHTSKQKIRKAKKLLFELQMIETIHAPDNDGIVRTYTLIKE